MFNTNKLLQSKITNIDNVNKNLYKYLVKDHKKKKMR